MEKEKKKSKYNEWQTVGFMLRTAWEIREKKVIFIMLSLVALNVGQNLVGIFITPPAFSPPWSGGQALVSFASPSSALWG